MIEFEKPNIKCLEIDNDNNYAKFVKSDGLNCRLFKAKSSFSTN